MSILSRTSSISIILGLTLSLASCSSPRDASKENFKKVIKAYIKDIPACDLGNYSLPLNIFEKDPMSDSIKNNTKYLDFMVSIGFLEANKKNIVRPSFIIFGSHPLEPAKVYDLTAEGRKNSRVLLKSETEKMLGGADSSSRYSFCYAKGRELIDIGAFGDPVEQEGMKVVKVPFTYKVTGMADWVDKYPEKEKEIHEQNFDTLTLELTNEGWRANPFMK
jgi:hypothetical protein